MNGGEMSETKDPAIKLFGKMIPFPVSQIPAKSDEKSDEGCQIPEKSEVMDMCSEISKTEAEDVHSEESRMPDKFSVIKNGKEEDHQMLNLKPKEDSSTDQEKVLKKPDKVLPCPRCNSSETKFCYFNNYNVNQPRHFCKNCQRYWTAGGTMRNVPVGAGRRKNKHLASQFRQVLVPPDGVPITTCGESPTSSRPSTGNGTFAESTATVMKCTEIASEGENREDRSSCSTSMTVSSVWENENVLQKEQGGSPGSCNELTQPLQCYPVPPWVFAWNPGWNNAASMPDSVNPNPIQWCSMPVVAVPGLCAPNIPLQFVPVWAAGTKNMPFSCSGNNPGTLGKHARDGNLMDEENSEKCVLAPKTLRIDDQDEASKSSIWTTLGFKSDQKETESRCGIFKPFISITEDNVHPSDAAQVLEANPAALSRSQTFREST